MSANPLPTSELAKRAMRAGMEGRNLPDFGDKLTPEQLATINTVYEEGRNWSAASKTKAKH